MKDTFATIAEAKIQEAIAQGQLKNLPGKGKPVVMDNMAFVPAEERLAFHIMKNANIQPVEVSLAKEMEKLRQSIKECKDENEKGQLENKLKEMNLRYNIMMEKRRSRR